MLDWSERQLDRLMASAQFVLLCRVQPELRRLETVKDRRWAQWFVADAIPWWKRALMYLMLLVVGPMTTIIGASVALRMFDAMTFGRGVLVIVFGAVVGFLMAGRIVQAFTHNIVQESALEAMRISGHDVCPECGYDMTGHRMSELEHPVCPECAATVPTPVTSRAA